MLLLISEASMVCVTLDVTNTTTTTTVPVMATSMLLWAFISSLARLRRVEEASPGDPGRFLLSSMVLIVTGEIPGPILHCGRCHTLDTRALDDLMCSLPDVARQSMKFLDLVYEIPRSRKYNFSEIFDGPLFSEI